MSERHICSVSGGKDSTALYLWAIERFGADGFEAVFADTGHEHPVTYNYLRNLPKMAGGPDIHWVKADFSKRLQDRGREPSGNPFLDLCFWKGRVPSPKAQFCTEHLKLLPIRDWLHVTSDDREPVMLTGIRAGESKRRSKMAEREWLDFYDCDTWRPLLKWSEEEVFAFLKKHDVPPNPLYAAGFTRVGCFPCIHARKGELARLPEWTWEKLEDWERRIGRSWFSGTADHIPTVAEMKEWSKTSRGGKQFDMFAPDGKDVPSCMSTWGACE